jgi:hypothetical protein
LPNEEQFVAMREASFTMSSNTAGAEKLGRNEVAAAAMQMAVRHRTASPLDLYGRRLISEKKNREALENSS